MTSITTQTTIHPLGLFVASSAILAEMLEARRQRRRHARNVQYYRYLDRRILDDIGVNVRALYGTPPKIVQWDDTE